MAHLACPKPRLPRLRASAGAGQSAPCTAWSGREATASAACTAANLAGRDFLRKRANTPLFRACAPLRRRSSPSPRHLAEGAGPAAAPARLCGVGLKHRPALSPNASAATAERFHDEMVRHVQPRQIQPDEAWSFVGKKKINTVMPTTPRDAEQGSYWDHVIIDPGKQAGHQPGGGPAAMPSRWVQLFTDFYNAHRPGTCPETHLSRTSMRCTRR